MRIAFFAVIAVLLGGFAADAQPRPGSSVVARNPPRSGEVPVDHGPFTPEASSAYQGGGVILQGAPGAPPPTPEPTPPGQMPRNMVAPR